MVTFVAMEHNRAEGEAVLQRTLKHLSNCAQTVDVHTEVVVKSAYGLLEIMQVRKGEGEGRGGD